jgi:hypothetical protein
MVKAVSRLLAVDCEIVGSVADGRPRLILQKIVPGKASRKRRPFRRL